MLDGGAELVTGAGQQAADQRRGEEGLACLGAAQSEAVGAGRGLGRTQATARTRVGHIMQSVAAKTGTAAGLTVVVPPRAVHTATHVLGCTINRNTMKRIFAAIEHRIKYTYDYVRKKKARLARIQCIVGTCRSSMVLGQSTLCQSYREFHNTHACI